MSGQGSQTSCTACGAEVVTGARFCRSCGVEIRAESLPVAEPTVAGCPACGAAVSPGARFCRFCGAEQDAPAVADPPGEAVTEPLGQGSPHVAPPASGESGSRGGLLALVVALVLVFGAAGGGGAYFLLLAPDEHGPLDEPSSLAIDDRPQSADAAPASSSSSGSSIDEDTGGAVSEGGEPEVLPDVAAHEMEADIEEMLRHFHEAVVDRRFDDAWQQLSDRKRAQIEADEGFVAWRKAQATLSPYLEPWGLEVEVEQMNRSQPVVQVIVRGMAWTKSGASCSEWSGLTWVRYEFGGWTYDPGYSTTPQRQRRWKQRYSELLGASC